MNNCSFVGRLTRDVEAKAVGENTVFSFSLAVDGGKKNCVRALLVIIV